MQIIDILILSIVGYAAYKGFKNGLLVEIASIISYVIGIFIALKFSKTVAIALHNSLHWSPKTTAILSFLGTFLLVLIAVHYLAKMLSSFAEKISIGWINKLGGAFFGILKMVLIIGVILQLFIKINYNNMLMSKEKQETSIVFKPVVSASQLLTPIVTNWANEIKEQTIKTLDQNNEESTTQKDTLQ